MRSKGIFLFILKNCIEVKYIFNLSYNQEMDAISAQNDWSGNDDHTRQSGFNQNSHHQEQSYPMSSWSNGQQSRGWSQSQESNSKLEVDK